VRQAIARAAGFGEQHAACLLATSPAPERGHQEPLSRGCLGRMPQQRMKPFAVQHIRHMVKKHRGVKPLERLCVDKSSS